MRIRSCKSHYATEIGSFHSGFHDRCKLSCKFCRGILVIHFKISIISINLEIIHSLDKILLYFRLEFGYYLLPYFFEPCLVLVRSHGYLGSTTINTVARHQSGSSDNNQRCSKQILHDVSD